MHVWHRGHRDAAQNFPTKISLACLCVSLDPKYCDAGYFPRSWEIGDAVASSRPLAAFQNEPVSTRLAHASGWAKNWHSRPGIYEMFCCHHYCDGVPRVMKICHRTIAN